jgi:hypothetical protein
LEKCVGGTYTTLIDTSITYVAGAVIEMRGTKSGTTLSVDVYYNGTQVGTTQAITDAGIYSNTMHGLFSADASNTLSSFGVTRL